MENDSVEGLKKYTANNLLDFLTKQIDKDLMAALVKELEVENARLKKMYADECLKSDILQDAMTKKW